MRDYLEEYDETDPISIETYAKRLIGQTFLYVLIEIGSRFMYTSIQFRSNIVSSITLMHCSVSFKISFPQKCITVHPIKFNC